MVPLVVPQYHELMWPALKATEDLGGSATVREMNAQVIESQGFSEELQEVPHGDGRTSELEYRLAWARTHLRGIGASESSARGVWAITDHGRSLTEAEMQAETKVWRSQLQKRRTAQQDLTRSPTASDGGPDDGSDFGNWKDALVVRLLSVTWEGFERLVQRLLREAGFVNVTVTGRSGDGGIDGMGTYRLSLVSFPVYFQCKRYKGSVTVGTVRDFRGAMSGRGEKGFRRTRLARRTWRNSSRPTDPMTVRSASSRSGSTATAMTRSSPGTRRTSTSRGSGTRRSTTEPIFHLPQFWQRRSSTTSRPRLPSSPSS